MLIFNFFLVNFYINYNYFIKCIQKIVMKRGFLVKNKLKGYKNGINK